MTDLTNLNGLTQADFTALSVSDIQTLSPAAVASLDLTHCQWLTSAQLAALTPNQVAAMSPSQVAAFSRIDTLTLAVVGGLSPAQTATLTQTLKSVSAAWLNALTPAAVAALPVSTLTTLGDSTAVKGLGALTVAAMTPQQIGALRHPDWLPPAAVCGLSAAQIPSITISWSYMSADWLNALSAPAVAAVPLAKVKQISAAAVTGLSSSLITSLSPQQFAVLPAVAGLSADAVSALSAAQLGALSSLSTMNAPWINALSSDAIGAMPIALVATLSSGAVSGLTADTMRRLSIDQMAALPAAGVLVDEAAAVRNAALGQWASVEWSQASADWLNGLSADDLSTVPPGALAVLPATTVQSLFPATIAALSPQQVGSLAHIEVLSAATVAALTPDQVGAISQGWNLIGAAWLNALSPQTCAAIPLSVMGQLSSSAWRGLTAATVTAMTPQQLTSMASFSYLSYSATRGLTADDIRAMTPAQVGQLSYADWLSTATAVPALSPDQVAQIKRGWNYMAPGFVAALSPEAFAAIAPTGIAQLTGGAVGALTTAQVHALNASQMAALPGVNYLSANGIAGLRPETIQSLTVAQIASLSHPESLSADAVAALSAAQTAAIAPAAWSKVTGAWLGALSADGFSGIPVDAYRTFTASAMRSLTAEKIQGVSAEQFGAMSNPGWIPVDAVGAIRADQLSQVTDWDSVSARWLNALTPEAFAAIPAAGVNQMSLAALQGLDASHRGIALQQADSIHAGYIGMAPSDPSLSYDNVLTSLSQMAASIGDAGLSADQFAALNGMLSGARAANGGTTYVSSLLSSLMADGVQPNASADTFTASFNKWFMGTNNPTVAAGKGYVDVTDLSLFNGSTLQASLPISQGQIGDCWLLSSLEELSVVAPERLSGMIGANGNGTYAVKFYNGNNPLFVTVNGSVANYGASLSGGSWTRLIEAAYAEARGSNLLSANGYKPADNDYSVLGGGWEHQAMSSLIGGTYATYSSGAKAYTAVVSALASGNALVTYDSNKSSKDADGKTQLVSGHAFAITGIDADNGNLIFRNPWGASYGFEMSATDLDAISGTGYFNVFQMGDEYGAATVASGTQSAQGGTGVPPQATLPTAPVSSMTIQPEAMADAANLLQAMAGFDVPAAVTSTLTQTDTQQAVVALATPH